MIRWRALRPAATARRIARRAPTASQSETAHRPQTGSGKFRPQSAPAGSWQTNPLVERAQDARGRAPDIALRIRHRVIGALHAAKFLAVHLVVRRIHQEGQRHLEGIDDLAMVDAQCKAGPDAGDRRQDAESEAGAVDVEIADRIDEGAVEPDLLLGLAQRGVER